MIDANFPSGANEILPKIRALTDKPIRFAFDTHHHGDHAYGNLVKAKKSAQQVRDAIDLMNTTLAADAQIARYVGKGNSFAAQVEKVYTEVTGQQLPSVKKVARAVRDWHTLSHGLDSIA